MPGFASVDESALIHRRLRQKVVGSAHRAGVTGSLC
jgi:hypothetical protein